MYGLILDKSTGMDAAHFADKLKAKGIETRLLFSGCMSNLYFILCGFSEAKHTPLPKASHVKVSISRQA